MTTIYFETETIEIPSWVTDHASFRRWARSEDFPESGRICFINEKIFVDVSKEQFFSHNQVKQEFSVVLGSLAKKSRLGRYVPDGMLFSNTEAELTTQPDGAFISQGTLKSGQVTLVEGAVSGFVELEGIPDMVLEVVRKGHTPARSASGHVKSQVFGKSFRLTRQLDDDGNPEFTLSVR
jgi:hypothetical protein